MSSSANGHDEMASTLEPQPLEQQQQQQQESSKIELGSEPLQIIGQLKSIEQINKQRRLFLNSTITEEKEAETELRTKATPPCTLALNVKYATLPSALQSPLSPLAPPKPPMLSRTRSTGSGDIRNGKAESEARHSLVETASKVTAVEPMEREPEQSISGKHYEGLIEELRCPGCAGAMKAPVLLCRSGHSVCEQCTRILLMCPLCKEAFTSSRSLTVEALCAKALFRCSHAAGDGGCSVRMPVALLPWHEQQCIYKPMKCFMGRVWGDCKWHGREVQWKQHLETEHADKLFNMSSNDLVWNVGERRKPLAGYYVFLAHGEMFNFYEIHDKQRVLFTMTCTSSRRDSKYNFAYEVTLMQPDNEALAMTQKFPVHSEHDRDILMEGTCVSVGLAELARFVDDEKLLHYRVSVLAVKSPRKSKPAQRPEPLPIDYQQTQIAGVNGKSVPASMIITRTYKEAMGGFGNTPATTPLTSPSSTVGESDSDSLECGGSAEPERKWGTPQLHFNRRYLKQSYSDANGGDAGGEDELRPLGQARQPADDKLSLCSTTHNSSSYTRRMSDTLRKSFRAIKTDIIEMRPFKKSPEKITANTNGNGK